MGELLKFSLEDHLTECETRYNSLLDHIDRVDRKLNHLEDLVKEILKEIKRQ